MELEAPVNTCLVCLSLTALALHLYLRPTSTSSTSTSSSSTHTSTSTSSSSPLTSTHSTTSTTSTSPSLTSTYLPAHLLALFSDWLQSPYTFQLYKQHGLDEGSIALLFLTGNLSSCILGSFIGPLADKFGRRCLSQIICVVCCLETALKVLPYFPLLLLGRFLSGVSTSCLFTVLESWFVSEHQLQGLPPSDLSSTLAMVTTATSLLAVLGGLLADSLVSSLQLGVTAPSLASLPCLAAALLVISLAWKENYGVRSSPLLTTYKEGISLILASPHILRLAAVQALVEASMFLFIFLWTPTLTSGGLLLPLGRIFALFMVCITLGSCLFRLLLRRSWPPQSLLLLACLLFLASCLLASLLASSTSLAAKQGCLLAFVSLEVALGVYFPSMATLRSQVVPSSHRSTVTSLCRLPLNILSVSALLAVKSGHLQDRAAVFLLMSLFLFLASSLTRAIKVEAKVQLA